jgi:hypothetical protein
MKSRWLPAAGGREHGISGAIEAVSVPLCKSVAAAWSTLLLLLAGQTCPWGHTAGKVVHRYCSELQSMAIISQRTTVCCTCKHAWMRAETGRPSVRM